MNLKSGDDVIIDSSSTWRPYQYELAKVVKVTPKGVIIVDKARVDNIMKLKPMKFRPDGTEITSCVQRNKLREVTPEILDIIKRKELLCKINFEKIAGLLSADKLEKIFQWQEELLG